MEQELIEEVVEEFVFELVVSSLVFAFVTEPTGSNAEVVKRVSLTLD